MKVAVIGAGIGGLALTVGLQRRGHDVTVYERDTTPRATGNGLALFANTFHAARSIGVDLGPFIRTAPQLPVGHRTPGGTPLTTISARFSQSLHVVHHSDLHAHLISLVEPDTIRFGTHAHAPSDGHPSLTVRTAGQRPHRAPFDLVVAADGITSPTRTSLGLDTGIADSGHSAWRGITATPVPLRGQVGETWGHGERFGYLPLADGRVYWFAVMPASNVSSEPYGLHELHRRFGSWHAPIPEILSVTNGAAISRHRIRSLRKPLSSFTAGRTALLGDAAHAMWPDLGQGAGQAFEDAATLLALITHEPHALEQALHTYSQHRTRRTRRLAATVRISGQLAQLSPPWATHTRNAVLAIMPNRILEAVMSYAVTHDARSPLSLLASPTRAPTGAPSPDS